MYKAYEYASIIECVCVWRARVLVEQVAISDWWLAVSQLSHFLRDMTLVHISKRPFFASLSGKLAMACAARSTWSCAKARVCSMPSLSMTRVRA